MRRALITLVVLVIASASGCGRPEWAVPRSGEAACMCSIVCACGGMSQNEESQKERNRCRDACSCDVCPGENPSIAGSSSPAP